MARDAPLLRCAAQTAALCLSLATIQSAAGAERWQFGVLASSDNVQRGLSHSDAGPAFHAGARYQFDSGVYAGVWASTVSNGRTTLKGAAGRHEVQYMAGHARPLGRDWGLDLALLRYEYPDSDAPVDYGYTELSVSAGFRDRLRLSFAVSHDATIYTQAGFRRDATTRAWELVGSQPLGARFSGLAGIGHFDLGAGAQYLYFNTGLAMRLTRLDVELQYVDTDKAERLFGRRLAGPRVVLAAMVSFQ
jgi:uncharacterized protein (TIGR02001 family)